MPWTRPKSDFLRLFDQRANGPGRRFFSSRAVRRRGRAPSSSCVMSRWIAAGAALAALAKNLELLLAQIGAADRLAVGPERVRAALAVLRAHVELARELGPE